MTKICPNCNSAVTPEIIKPSVVKKLAMVWILPFVPVGAIIFGGKTRGRWF